MLVKEKISLDEFIGAIFLRLSLKFYLNWVSFDGKNLQMMNTRRFYLIPEYNVSYLIK